MALLKKKSITFKPELSPRKQLAISRLGAGLIEKILLRYDTKWWSYKIGGADFFGSIMMTGSDSGVDAEDDHEHSGIFNVFYDIPSPEGNQVGWAVCFLQFRFSDRNMIFDHNLFG